LKKVENEREMDWSISRQGVLVLLRGAEFTDHLIKC